MELHHYPWPNLERSLDEEGKKFFLLAGLGSLINCHSARRTLSQVSIPAKPIKVLGFKRVYDYVIAENYLSNKQKPISCPYAALNAYPSEKDWFNAVLLRVTLADIAAFREREVGYDLLPAQFVPYEERNVVPRRCFVLSRPRVPSLFRLMGKGISPGAAYHNICREGSAQISRAFLRDFYRTTFLADRETRLEDFLGDVELKPKHPAGKRVKKRLLPK